MDTELEAAVEGLAVGDGPGAAVAVMRGSRLLWRGGTGLANLEWEIPIAADTVFRIGSVTKQFTAAAIMLLVEDGRVGLDDAIDTILTDYPTFYPVYASMSLMPCARPAVCVPFC